MAPHHATREQTRETPRKPKPPWGSHTGGLATVRVIRREHPVLPCILLSKKVEKGLLGKALELEVFSVIDKPVNLGILQQQLNRMFIKKYNSNVFA